MSSSTDTRPLAQRAVEAINRMGGGQMFPGGGGAGLTAAAGGAFGTTGGGRPVAGRPRP